ncbi:similar to ILITYHIA [Actinidia rufa]|uniref:Similar to ILITYHIA n=1 Tax=Actinidia rufa TaxID=165716 RepID=A0A7J0FW61_9ERIC|nr:similar to ILITYHIA [Actinidia rufa]
MGLTDPNDCTKLSLDILLQVLVDPIPEVWSVAARALVSLIRGMGEENSPDLVPCLLDTLKSDGSNVERSGAAQGLSEVRV